MSSTITTVEPDWAVADSVAAGLGLNTRRLVADRNAEQAITWALQMSREYSGVAALSYYELAVMLGHHDEKVRAGARLSWNELLQSAQKLAATVKAKAAEETAASAQKLQVLDDLPESPAS